MLTGSCHCASVGIEVSTKPTILNQCHCSICWRYGVLWAYYQKAQVKIIAEPDATETYIWGDKTIKFHRCKKCGCVTHWSPINEESQRTGINARLLDEGDLEGIEIRQTLR